MTTQAEKDAFVAAYLTEHRGLAAAETARELIATDALIWRTFKTGMAAGRWDTVRWQDEADVMLRPPPARNAEAAPEKIAPVQGYTPGIPWSLHLEAYDAYSKRWAPQPAMIDLDGRNCRGGFSTGELDQFIPGWRDRVSEIGRLKARITELEAALAAPTRISGPAAEDDTDDMAEVGRALMRAIEAFAPEGWHPNDCPSEIVGDLRNLLDEATRDAK